METGRNCCHCRISPKTPVRADQFQSHKLFLRPSQDLILDNFPGSLQVNRGLMIEKALPVLAHSLLLDEMLSLKLHVDSVDKYPLT